MSDETKKDHGILGRILDKVGLRGAMHGLGGRKAVVGGGAIGAITLIAQTEMGDWPKAIACLAVGIVAAATTISIALEDKKK